VTGPALRRLREELGLELGRVQRVAREAQDIAQRRVGAPADPAAAYALALLLHNDYTGVERLLRFRHLVRNLYVFDLDWAELRGLAGGLAELTAALSTEVGAFGAFLDAAAS
jgi:8-oxo-dGTP pyrophosphatase MutT (NUDIX family)